MSRQAAITYRKGKPERLRLHEWRTWGKASAWTTSERGGRKALPRRGHFRRWGVIKEYHEANKIMCDYDTKKIPSPPLQSLVHTLGLHVLCCRWDRTVHGWHLIVNIRESLQDAEIVAAQAILGSDLARERLNLARAISIRLHPSKFWAKRINLLFKRKIRVKGKRHA
jgi:hypothetical protein